MKRTVLAVTVVTLGLVAAVLPAAGDPRAFTPGAPSIGDAYFPFDGNGGYDVRAYLLDLAYDPATDELEGTATIRMRATQDLSRFNLDFDGMTVDAITVDGRAATSTRGAGELRVTPAAGIPRGTVVDTVVTYHGVPPALPPEDDGGGFLTTEDGAVAVGQPHVAATWFPANDHPRDRARFDITMTVPDDLEVVANGRWVGTTDAGPDITYRYSAAEPMAPYLATVAIGEFVIEEYRWAGAGRGAITFVDAIDAALFEPLAPHDGTRFLLSGAAQQSYKRLARTIAVPGDGATMTFWVDRATESGWDHLLVEARTDGQDDWTTLPDANGHTSTSVGDSCPYWLDLHPFLTHYQTASGQTCTASGTSGTWNAASGSSGGWEQWSVDLGAFAGQTAEVAISYVSDDSVQARGVALDEVVVSTGEGTTSFEDDGDVLDGWTVAGPPPGSIANANDWAPGTVADAPTPPGEVADDVFALQRPMLNFLARRFGRYPFSTSGGYVDDVDTGFALENQTRAFYPPDVFGDPVEAEATVVHELAHQWYGDHVALHGWRHIWLNEGFATYAEWLWSQYRGRATAQQLFDAYYRGIPAASDFWDVVIGDPGPEGLFSGAVYYRGAMTLHALRREVGEADFFRILRRWAYPRVRVPATTANFIALAERVSGEQLDALFAAWLFSDTKPARTEALTEAAGPVPESVRIDPAPVHGR